MTMIPANFFLLFATCCIVSCSKNGNGAGEAPDCSTVANKSFAADVNPIIQSTCNQAGCHAAGSSNGPGALTNYAQVSAAATQVRASVLAGRMPQNGSLSTGQRNAIICWVESGAPNN